MSARAKLQDMISYPPRGLRADRAAAYLGLSKTKFLELVDNGIFPAAKRLDGVRVWDRVALDSAFSAIPEAEDGDDTPEGRPNSFDVILGGR